MKKTIKTGIGLLLLFAFVIASGTAVTTVSAESEAGKLTTDQIIAMSNYMNSGGIGISGKWKVHWSGENVVLKSINTVSGESTLIDKDEIAFFINVDGIWITYLSNGKGSAFTKDAEIKRVRVTGGCEETLISKTNLPISGAIFYLFMHGDYMYFSVLDETTDPFSGGFFRANKDGADITQVLNKAAYYPYIIGEKLYYQGASDGAKLHVCNLDGSGDRVFIDDVCYRYITDGETFYYTTAYRNEDISGGVIKAFHPERGTKVISDIMPTDTSIAYDGGAKLFYADGNDSDRLYYYDLQTGEVDNIILNTHLRYFNFDQSAERIIAIDVDDKNYYENTLSIARDGSSVSIY